MDYEKRVVGRLDDPSRNGEATLARHLENGL